MRIVDILHANNPVEVARTFVRLRDSFNPSHDPMKSLIRTSAVALILLATANGNVKAQYAWDFGVHIGGANYLGEMGGKEQTRRDFIWDLKMSQTRWCFGGFARRKINRLVSVNAGLLYFRLQGADALSTNPQRVGRNLNFRNDMLEAYLRGEFTIFADNDLGGKGRYKTDFRLFGYVGVAGFYHNPKGQINREGEFYNLANYDTELVDYSNIGVAVPVGIGFHFTKRRRHRFGWDFGWRTTFTDYIDDVSTTYVDPIVPGDPNNATRVDLYDMHSFVDDGPAGPIPGPLQYGYHDTPGVSTPSKNKRGDPTHNDSYLTMTFTYSYVLKGQSNFYRQRYNWMRGKKRIGRKSRAKF